MSTKTNRLRWVFVVVITAIFASGDGQGVGQQTVGPTAPAPILTGKWKLDTGEIITITQDARRIVTAMFTPPVRCLSNSTRTIFFKGELKLTGTGDMATAKLEGDQFWACTRTPAMVTECGVQELFSTKFRAEVSPFSITGESFRPHYDFEMVNGRRTNCRRNSEKDEWGAPFSLTPLCRPSTPWFDKGAACQDAQPPLMTSNRPGGGVLSICGFAVFHYEVIGGDAASIEAYNRLLVADLTRQIGDKICCQAFRQAVQTGQPCDPSVDLDCDGKPNRSDYRIETPGPGDYPDIKFPDINIFSSPPGASVAPFPQGLNPDDPGFVPNSGGCDCKWQLIKGELNCGTGGQGHSYVATWKCPTSGREVTTTRNATPNTPCP